jgi:hypothetical protein
VGSAPIRSPHFGVLAREGALDNFSPALGAGFREGSSDARPRRRPLQSLTPLKHFVVAASAATKLGRVLFPRAERGAKIFKRAFARIAAAECRTSRHFLTPSQDDSGMTERVFPV